MIEVQKAGMRHGAKGRDADRERQMQNKTSKIRVREGQRYKEEWNGMKEWTVLRERERERKQETEKVQRKVVTNKEFYCQIERNRYRDRGRGLSTESIERVRNNRKFQ